MMTWYGLTGFITALLVESPLQHTIILMVSCSQSLDSLQSDTVLNHIRSLNPTIHSARIGELFQYCNFYVLTVGVPTRKNCRLLTIQNLLG